MDAEYFDSVVRDDGRAVDDDDDDVRAGGGVETTMAVRDASAVDGGA